jgi:hypothetical protein
MIAVFVGVLLIPLVLWDTFESVILPRRIARRVRPARVYYLATWRAWRAMSLAFPAGRRREHMLSIFGPLSMLGLFAIWAAALIVGFALIHWGGATLPGELRGDFRECLYMSGETFFTLGYGDVTPQRYPGKLLAVAEAGVGFGFMAVVIGYLPVFYQSFSLRERSIALLDARAGSPPTASELLRRAGGVDDVPELTQFLVEWEVWCAELLANHLSFPVLSFYRSQHDNQSWLAALAVVLDTSAVLIVTGAEATRRRAQLTFAMARHTAVDLCLVVWLRPRDPAAPRLTSETCGALLPGDSSGLSPEQAARLAELRELYEPFLAALAEFLRFPLPGFFPDRPAPDNWQTSAWTKRAPGLTDLPGRRLRGDEHFG